MKMSEVLLLKRNVLKSMIRERYANARKDGRPKPDVSMLSETIREVDRKIAEARKQESRR